MLLPSGFTAYKERDGVAARSVTARSMLQAPCSRGSSVPAQDRSDGGRPIECRLVLHLRFQVELDGELDEVGLARDAPCATSRGPNPGRCESPRSVHTVRTPG
jgi:hypothetical protein